MQRYEQRPVFQGVDRVGPDIISFLADEGVTRGYSDYFNSHPLTYRSDGRIHSYPVLPCRRPVSPALCPFPVNVRSVWYRPTSGTKVLPALRRQCAHVDKHAAAG